MKKKHKWILYDSEKPETAIYLCRNCPKTKKVPKSLLKKIK